MLPILHVLEIMAFRFSTQQCGMPTYMVHTGIPASLMGRLLIVLKFLICFSIGRLLLFWLIFIVIIWTIFGLS